MVVGLLSVGWLAWIIFQASDSPPSAAVAAAPPSGEVTAVVPPEVPLDERLANLETDVRELRRSNTGTAVAARDLDRRIAKIEDTFEPATTGAIDRSRDEPPFPKPPSTEPPPQSMAAAKSSAPALSAERAPTAPQHQASRSPISIVPPKFDPSRSGTMPAFALDLGGFDNLGVLRSRWSELTAENRQVLGDLTARTVTYVNSDGTRTFRLIAGPFTDVAETGRLCAALRGVGVTCAQTMFVGEPL